MTQPAVRLRLLARRVCSESTMERLVDPLIADMQCEHDAAIRGGRPWQARRTLLIGYVGFWKVVGLMAPAWAARSVRRWTARDDGAVGRTLGFAALATMIVTALLIVPPARSQMLRSGLTSWTLWMVVLMIPQAIPLSLPFGLLVGVLCGLRGRRTTSRVRRAILIVGLIGSVAAFGTIGWLVPAANQAFRVAVAGRVAGPVAISRGIAETPLPTLRERALDLERHGRAAGARELMIAYHVRWSLAAAALGFALFGFSVAALRLGRVPTAAVGAAAPLVYIAYLWTLNDLRMPALGSEGAAIAASWLPNVVLILVTIALHAMRRDAADMDLDGAQGMNPPTSGRL